MSEANLRKRMREGVKQLCFFERIENMVGEGAPDILLHHRVTGKVALVELKFRAAYPVRASTPVFSGSHGLRPAQKAWIHARAMVWANIWILAQCDGDLYVLKGSIARELDTLCREDLIAHECCVWLTDARRTRWDRVVLGIF